MIVWAIGKAFAVLCICALVFLALSARAQVEFTTKGSIVVACDGVQVSQHTVETEATESAIAHAVKKGGKSKCMFVYPNKEVLITVGSAPPTDPTPPVTGSATINWTAPTLNTDGSALTNLAGYRIAYGTSASALTGSVQAGKVTSHTIPNLAAGTWHFAVVAVDANGVASAPSNTASKVIQ